MAILYKKYQNKNDKSKTYGKWYGKAVIVGNISTKELAREIASATTVTYTDVIAVLFATAEVLGNHLRNSQSVTLDDIGTFKVGPSTTPAADVDSFSGNNISGYRINYAPIRHFIVRGVNEKGNRVGVFINDLLEGSPPKRLPRTSMARTPRRRATQAAATVPPAPPAATAVPPARAAASTPESRQGPGFQPGFFFGGSGLVSPTCPTANFTKKNTPSS